MSRLNSVIRLAALVLGVTTSNAYAARGGQNFGYLELEELEYRAESAENIWSAQGWYGSDRNKLWVKTEGERASGTAEGEVQLLFSRLFSPYFDWQAGIRSDFGSESPRTYGVVGIQGLAPYWFEVDAAAFVSVQGELTASAEASYELRFTQRLIAEPSVALGLSAQDVPELGIGTGLTGIETGFRVRYEITREIAPYFGITRSRHFGTTATLVPPGEVAATTWVAGLRLWY